MLLPLPHERPASPLHLQEADVLRSLTMAASMRCVEAAFRAQAEALAASLPRQRMRTQAGQGGSAALLHVLPGTYAAAGVLGVKCYASTRLGTHFMLVLHAADTGQVLATIEADHLGRMRTGAASGVATQALARPDARVAAVIGAGKQARSQALALACARPLDEMRLHGRTRRRVEELAATLGEDFAQHGALHLPRLVICDTAEEAARGAHIVTTITSASTPVLDGAWLAPGCHVNAAGSNALQRQEINAAAVLRASCIVVDDLAQAQAECGDLAPVVEAGQLRWEQVVPLAEVLVGRVAGRRAADDITLFESQGVATEDLAVGLHLYLQALQATRS